MNKYKLISITDHNNKPKDNVATPYINSICEILNLDYNTLIVEANLLLNLIEDDEGNSIKGSIRTSKITEIQQMFDDFRIETKNSVYILEKVK